ncbi:SH3 domain-containing protein [Sphingomonas sp. LB3N6]|uniref:SH3 domain-containing protein n=1 Tax=Sphingomonas fucosidasi TaxID=3096164 RepID=UPI003FA6E699
MRGIMRCLVIVLGLISGTASATTVTSNVNCRNQPRATARIVARISAGTEVPVERRQDDWSLIRHAPRSCWVASRYLGAHSTAEANRASLRQTRAVSRSANTNSERITRPSHRSSFWSSTPHRSTRRKNRARSAPGYNYGGGSCPCSGRNICVGPRGGRYCITSGGNKRYGV